MELRPLLRREISIDEIAIEGIEVRLETEADGTTNWAFERESSETPTAASDGPAYVFVRLGELTVRSLIVSYHDAVSGETHEFDIEAIDGSMGRDDPVVLSARGLARNQPFDVSVTGGTLAALSDPTQPWSLDVTAQVADAVLTLRGRIVEPLRKRSRRHPHGPICWRVGLGILPKTTASKGLRRTIRKPFQTSMTQEYLERKFLLGGIE